MVLRLVQHERPMLFFGTNAGLLTTISIVISVRLDLFKNGLGAKTADGCSLYRYHVFGST
jgi:hypothetical protein